MKRSICQNVMLIVVHCKAKKLVDNKFADCKTPFAQSFFTRNDSVVFK